jgi:tRNA pseudouridine55 synthase
MTPRAPRAGHPRIKPASRSPRTQSGVLVVSKASGITSFGVVTLVRQKLGVRRIGHGGTLDPGAVGVLPILIDEATKLMPYLLERDKEYVVTLRLGVKTDTQDLGGRILATAPVPPLGAEDLIRATRPFVGLQRQVPPMYSAVHHEGRRLYELARKGIEVPREPRDVMVHAITVEEVAVPMVRLWIVCGKGTYVRALVADLGEALGCGAAVESLLRRRVGPFGLDEALSSSEIAAMPTEAVWARVRSPESALVGWPVVQLEEPAASAFLHGQEVLAPVPPPAMAGFVVVHAAAGGFLGVGRTANGRIKPARILHADRPGSRVLPA